MNVITAYLETMFSPYPRTPRMLEAKSELQAMMEDAYSALIAEGRSENEAVGKVITDFGNLDELAPVLGISAEIAPTGPAQADPRTAGGGASQASRIPQHPQVTMQEATGFADAQQRIRFRVSTAVSLFALSPVLLIVLPVAAESGAVPLPSGAAAAIGIGILLAVVAVGVMMIISTSRDLGPYKRLQEGRFSADPAVAAWADGLAQQHERGRIRALQIAILLWILSPAPLLALTLLTEESPLHDLWSVIGVGVLLCIVAVGLAILLPTTWAHTVGERLGSGARPTADDEERSIVGVIASFYWPLLTAIFLAWSFIGNAWSISWIIWPIGGVLFGAIAAGGGALEAYRKSHR